MLGTCFTLAIGRANVHNRELRQHARDLADPLLPGRRAPEVVDPKEATLEQVLPQALHFHVREPRGADVGPDQDRTLEQLIVAEPHHPVVDVAAGVATDGNLGEVRQPREQVDFAERVVGAPADAAGFRPDAPKHPLADSEAAVAEVAGRNPDARAGAFDHPEPLRPRHAARGDDDGTHHGEAGNQARHGWIGL
jgi:hypothetical protein